MNKKNIAITCGVIAVVLLSYVVVMPGRQVASYKQATETNQSKLNEKVNKVNDILDSDTFVKTDVEAAQVHADVKKGLESIKDAQSTLTLTDKELTHLNIAPGLGWNSAYKPAKDLRDNEQKYVDNTRSYLNELKAVLTYFDANADLDKEYENAVNDLSNADQTAETDEDYAKQVDAVIAKIDQTNQKVAALSAPESLKAAHEYNVATTKKLVQMLKDLSAAVKAQDYDKEDAIATDLSNLMDEAISKSDDYNADFIRNSSLRKLDDKLNDLDRTIERQIAKL